jgi:chemotaxis signal transduction protein
LPTQAHWCSGFVMFQGTPIVVADMARVLGTTSMGTPRIVVVLRTPERRDPFGLLVETLGDISEVSADRLLPIAEPNDDRGQLVEHAIQPTDPKDVLVLALSAERLSSRVGGETKISGALAREAAAGSPATALRTSEKPGASASSRY